MQDHCNRKCNNRLRQYAILSIIGSVVDVLCVIAILFIPIFEIDPRFAINRFSLYDEIVMTLKFFDMTIKNILLTLGVGLMAISVIFAFVFIVKTTVELIINNHTDRGRGRSKKLISSAFSDCQSLLMMIGLILIIIALWIGLTVEVSFTESSITINFDNIEKYGYFNYCSGVNNLITVVILLIAAYITFSIVSNVFCRNIRNDMLRAQSEMAQRSVSNRVESADRWTE